MKMMDEINSFRKDYVYEQYMRIVYNFKDYTKVTKSQMLKAIYEVYSDYANIIDICTTKELKYLKNIILAEQKGQRNTNFNAFDKKYEWEREALRDKFLIYYDINPYDISLPEEIKDKIKFAVKNTNWTKHKKDDELNEILVGYCKIQGTALINTVGQIGSFCTGIKEDIIYKHMLTNRLFNYYVAIISKKIDLIGDDILVAVHQDFYDIIDELDEERKKQGILASCQIDDKLFKTFFYNDFDPHNAKIKKFLTELQKLPFFWFDCLSDIKIFAMLNVDRTPLKEAFKEVQSLQNIDLTNFFKIMDEAMDEMPSGALNGLTLNEAKMIKVQQIQRDYHKKEEYIKQQNACLNPKDAKLFYKIYFGLLDFTNRSYQIKLGMKIYKKNGINPYEIEEIIEKFWQEKEELVNKFVEINPFKFSNEELEITKEFQKGIRGMFIIAKYEFEYTDIICGDSIYMVKGLNANIDEIIPYQDLPYITETSIIPFKNHLVYDGLLMGYNVSFGMNFANIVEKELHEKPKRYHL